MIHGKASYRRLATCHSDLQRLIIAAAEDAEIVVVSAHRNKEEQDDCNRRGTSKLVFPKSKHNRMPSEAVDVARHPIDWDDLTSFGQLAAHILRVAEKLGIAVTWGGSWRTPDLPHIELVG